MTTAKPTPSTTTAAESSPLQADAALWSVSDTAAEAGFLPDTGSNGPTLSVITDTASVSTDDDDEDATMLDSVQKCWRFTHYTHSDGI